MWPKIILGVAQLIPSIIDAISRAVQAKRERNRTERAEQKRKREELKKIRKGAHIKEVEAIEKKIEEDKKEK